MLINKDDFLKKITLASRFTSTRFSSNVLLSGVFLKKEKQTLHFYATNLNYYYHSFIKVEEDREDFEIVLEPKKIIDFLSFFSVNKIDFAVEKTKVIISHDKNRGEFPLYPKEDFPLPPKIEGKKQTIKAAFLRESFPLVLFSCSSDESRPVLTGVNLLTDEENVVLVGTDGFRLSLLKTKKEVDFPNVIIDSGFLNEVLYFIDKEEEVGFSYSEKEKTLYFQIEDNDLYSRIIEGDYPPFEKVIPAQEGKTKVFVDKESFLRNLKLISVFTRDFSNVVIFDIKKDGVYLRPKTEEEKNNNQAFLEAQVRGEEVKVAFNHKFLIDFLNHFKQKELVFEIIRPDAPVVFKDPEKDNFLHIIMPVRIQE